MPCRLILDPPAPGPWNMAVDEAMLSAVIDDPSRGATLRWYRWARPTLSLGYFQSIDDVPSDLATLPVVRRLTGGGAIVHDLELTYSLVLPADGWPRSEFLAIVVDVHRAIADELGLMSAIAGDVGRDEPFLCFERRSAQDLALGDSKIVGSAQRKRSGALLQHGSILLSTSPHAPHLPGLSQEAKAIDEQRLMDRVGEALESAWGWRWRHGHLDERETELARELVRTKYDQDAWNRRR